MKIKTSELNEQLVKLVQYSIEEVKRFKMLEISKLNFKQKDDTWSILECIEHLNLYGDFYLPEIQKQILSHQESEPQPIFKSGLMGNYFANAMLVKNGKINKMKTFKDKNPANSKLNVTTLDRFLKQQELLLKLLNDSKKVNLNRVKTGISITSLIRIKLGDTFRFYIYHIDRHIAQAQKVEEYFKKNK